MYRWPAKYCIAPPKTYFRGALTKHEYGLRLEYTHFPALGNGYTNLLLVLIGSLRCLRLLWLVRVITLFLVLEVTQLKTRLMLATWYHRRSILLHNFVWFISVKRRGLFSGRNNNSRNTNAWAIRIAECSNWRGGHINKTGCWDSQPTKSTRKIMWTTHMELILSESVFLHVICIQFLYCSSSNSKYNIKQDYCVCRKTLWIMYYSVMTQANSEKDIPSAPYQESNLRPSDY